MAFSVKMAKNWYKDLSVKELEEKYKELESNFCFKTKESQIKYTLENFLNVSHETNIKSSRTAIEELLKEKTGKEYKIEDNYFQITSKDLVDYISKSTNLLPNKTILINFIKNLTKINDKMKCEFLICLMQDKNNFENFVNEINKNQNLNEIFDKYLEITKNFYMKNNKKS